jgi:hypothetical protein
MTKHDSDRSPVQRMALERGDSPAELLAEACFELAQALWEAPPDRGRDRTRAMVLAQQARDELLGVGEARAEDVARIEQWLLEHGAEP